MQSWHKFEWLYQLNTDDDSDSDSDSDSDNDEVKTSHNLVLYILPCLELTIHIWCRLHCATIVVVWGL